MYTEYEVDGADSFGENFQKARKCTDRRTQGQKDGRTEGQKDGRTEGCTLKGDQAENRVPLQCSTGWGTKTFCVLVGFIVLNCLQAAAKHCTFLCSFHIWHHWLSAKCRKNLGMYNPPHLMLPPIVLDCQFCDERS